MEIRQVKTEINMEHKVDDLDQYQEIHYTDVNMARSLAKVNAHKHPYLLSTQLARVKREKRKPCSRPELLQRINQDRNLMNVYFDKLFQNEKPAVKERQAIATNSTLCRNSYDLFFESACASVKNLPPKLAAEAKSRISQVITEFELRVITEEEAEQEKHRKLTKRSMSKEDEDSQVVYTFESYTRNPACS